MPWRAEAALIDSALGRIDKARRLAREQLELARAFGRPRTLGMALRTSGLVEGGAAGERLLAAGLPAVESGFMDFALPDVAEAANRLLGAGCTHIVAAGVPALLHRHPYSFMGPSAAVELLRKKLPSTDIVYVQPDPEPIAPYLADVITSGVLEADENGQSLAKTLRKR